MVSLLADIKQYKNKFQASASKPGSLYRDISRIASLAGTCLGFITIYNIYGVDNVSASSLTVSVTDSAASIDLIAAEGGVAYGESDTASFSVSTTSSGGYTATITGGNSTGRLTGTDSNNYFTSISSAIASPSNFNNGTWGFKPSSYNSASNTSYQPVATSTSPATIDVTNSATTGNYTLSVAAKTDTTTAADTYSYNFIISATSNAIDYDVVYTDSGFPARTIGSTTGSTITLSSTIPTRDGYSFAGWCTVPVSPNTTCTGTTYAAGATYTLDSGSANNITLYAIWISDFFGITNMQDMTSTICANTTTPSTSATLADTDGSHRGNTSYVPRTTLKDTRDNTTYLVSKLADGNCWMSQNLELKLTAGTAVTAYNWNTDTTYNFTPQYTTQTTTGTAWEQAGNAARSYAFANNTYYGGTDITQTAPAKTSGQPYEKAGVLYNWYAATAGTGTSSVTSTAYGSICPKGWRLPANTTGENKSFSKLASTYGLPATNTNTGYSRQLQDPLNFNRPGAYGYDNGALTKQGAAGFFWSSVASSDTKVYHFYFDSSLFDPQDYNYKGHGFTVRCVND